MTRTWRGALRLCGLILGLTVGVTLGLAACGVKGNLEPPEGTKAGIPQPTLEGRVEDYD